VLAAAPNGIVRGEYVSCNYFQTLRARTTSTAHSPPTNAQLGAPRWRSSVTVSGNASFGGDSAIVGRRID
jgi:hypothetical protein